MNLLERLINLIFFSRHEVVATVDDRSSTSDLNTINGYYFEKYVLLEKRHKSFRYAVYNDQSKNAVFAKIWMGSRKNFDYYSLLNEINVYKALNGIGVQEGSDVRTPKFLGHEIAADRVVLLLEYIDGNKLSSEATDFSIEAYRRVLAFLLRLNKYKSTFLKYGVTKRHLVVYLFAFPVIILLLVCKRPELISKLYKAFYLFLLEAWVLPFTRTDEFLHRSMEHQNILGSGKNLYLIDFQLSVISHQYLEFIQTLHFMWHDRLFCTRFYNEIVITNIKSKLDFYRFRSLALYNVLYHMFVGNSKYEDSVSMLESLLALNFKELMGK